MSRVFEQRNLWGSQGGPNPQRADLWSIDFGQAVAGLNDQIEEADDGATDLTRISSDVESHHISSVKLPTVKVKADEVRRDSRPYFMPGFDEPLSEIGVTFIMESPVTTTTSKIYKFLEAWRAFVRAGRGPMGNEKSVRQLGKNYRVNFRFPVTITFWRGNADPKIANAADLSTEYYGTKDNLNSQLEGLSDADKNARLAQISANGGVFVKAYPVDNSLEASAIFQVENMWLSGFRVTDLDYAKGNEIVRIEASFYADSVVDLSDKAT